MRLRTAAIAASLCLGWTGLAALTIAPCVGLASVTTTTRSVDYVGNGVTTVYALPFRFLANADILVQVATVTKVLGVDYTLKGAGLASLGSVTFTAAPANAAAIHIERRTPAKQPTSFSTQGTFLPQVHETSFDRAAMAIQDAAAPNTTVDANTLSITSSGSTAARALVARAAEIKNVLDFGAAGDGVTNDATAINATIVAATAASTSRRRVTVLLPSGYRFKVTSAIAMASRVNMIAYGASIEAATDFDIVTGTSISDFSIAGGTYRGAGTAAVPSSAKAAVRLTSCSNFELRDIAAIKETISAVDYGIDYAVNMTGCSYGRIDGVLHEGGTFQANGDTIAFQSSSYLKIANVTGNNYRKALVYAGYQSGDNPPGGGGQEQNQHIDIANVSGRALSGSPVATGVAIRVLSGGTISNVDVDGGYYGGIFIQTEAADGSTLVEDLQISSVFSKNTQQYGILINGGNRASSMRKISLANVRTRTTGQAASVPGILVQGVAQALLVGVVSDNALGTDGIQIINCTDVQASGLFADTVKQYGLLISGVTRGAFNGVYAKDSSQVASGSYHDIFVTGSSTNIDINNYALWSIAANKASRAIIADSTCSNVKVGRGSQSGQTGSPAVDIRSTNSSVPIAIAAGIAVTGTTAETVLGSQLFYANSLGTAKAFRVRAAGTTAGAANTKTVKLTFRKASTPTGEMAMATVANAAGNNDNWSFDGVVMLTAAAVQVGQSVAYKASTPANATAAGTVDTTVDTSIAITGTLTDGADTITCKYFSFEPLN